MNQQRYIVRRKVARGSAVTMVLTVLGLFWMSWLINDPPDISGPFVVEMRAYDDQVGTSADHVRCTAIRDTDGGSLNDVRIGDVPEELAERAEITVEELQDELYDELASGCDRQRERRLLIIALVMPVVVALAASTVALRVWLRRLQPRWKRPGEFTLPDDITVG